jgi:hypothetical protein
VSIAGSHTLAFLFACRVVHPIGLGTGFVRYAFLAQASGLILSGRSLPARILRQEVRLRSYLLNLSRICAANKRYMRHYNRVQMGLEGLLCFALQQCHALP